MESGKVYIANINPGQVDAHFARCMFDLLAHDRQHWQRVHSVNLLTYGPFLAVSRNAMVEDFLKTDAEWMLFVDSDMAFPPDAIDRLFKWANAEKRPIVGGLCMDSYGKPVIRKWLGSGLMGPAEFKPTDGECVRVDGLGAAFLLIHRSAFLKMQEIAPPEGWVWFGEMCIGGRVMLGEDTGFCARADRAKLPIYVVRGVGIGHNKSRLIFENEPMGY